jgi:mRNA interferase MazF
MTDVGVPPHRFAVWEVVRVAFPYADQAEVRRRPALVIAVPGSPPSFGVVWLLMITTARYERWPEDVELSDWKAAGLGVPCVVRTGKIASMDTRLAEPIGRLGDADCRSVARAVRGLMSGVGLD